MFDRTGNSQFFYPGDLDALRDVCVELCQEEWLMPDSEEGLGIASQLISMFQSGLKDMAMLKIAVRAIRLQNSRRTG